MYSTPGGPAEHGRHEWVLWHPSGNQRNGLFQHSPGHAGQLTNEPTGEHPLSVCLIDCSPARNYTERVRESGRGGKRTSGGLTAEKDWESEAALHVVRNKYLAQEKTPIVMMQTEEKKAPLIMAAHSVRKKFIQKTHSWYYNQCPT